MTNEELINYIENDSEVAILIDELFNTEGKPLTKKEYGKVLIKYLVLELRKKVNEERTKHVQNVVLKTSIAKRKFKCEGCGTDRPCFVEINQDENPMLGIDAIDDLECILDDTNQTSFNWVEL